MLTTAAVLGIAAVALGIVLTPGPNMVYLVSRSITQGRRAGFVSLLGVAAGFFVYLLAAAAGLATVLAAVPVAYTVLEVAGAAYLLYLAWQAVHPGGGSAFAPAVQGLLLGASQIAIALTVNGLIVLGAGPLARSLAARPRWMRLQRYVMGAVLGALAVRLALQRPQPAAA